MTMTSTDQPKRGRGRPAGSKNATPKVLNGDPKPGEPLNNVTESTVLQYVAKLKAAIAKKDIAVNAIRSIRKQAKGDGIELKTVDSMLHLSTLDEHELTAMFNSQVAYAKYMEIPVFSQLTMFDTPDIDEESVAERAFSKGLKSGKLGENATENPYDAASAAGQRWLKGYGEGQAKLLLGIGELPEEAH